MACGVAALPLCLSFPYIVHHLFHCGLLFCSKHGGNMFLQNIAAYLPNYMLSRFMPSTMFDRVNWEIVTDISDQLNVAIFMVAPCSFETLPTIYQLAL
jgi:hypothetical protein